MLLCFGPPRHVMTWFLVFIVEDLMVQVVHWVFGRKECPVLHGIHPLHLSLGKDTPMCAFFQDLCLVPA